MSVLATINDHTFQLYILIDNLVSHNFRHEKIIALPYVLHPVPPKVTII